MLPAPTLCNIGIEILIILDCLSEAIAVLFYRSKQKNFTVTDNDDVTSP
jgi:hypothetical protein